MANGNDQHPDAVNARRIHSHLLNAAARLGNALYELDQAVGCGYTGAVGRSNVEVSLASVQARLIEIERQLQQA